MITKKCWWKLKCYICYATTFKKDLFNEYLLFLLTILITPVLLLTDLLLLPFEIGYYYFKKSLGK